MSAELFSAPVNPPGFGAVMAVRSQSVTKPEAAPPASVLAIDERRSDRDRLVSVLGHAGYAVLDSPAGAQTLGIAGAEHPNLIIAVVPMPAKGTNEQEFQRRQFQVLNAKLLLEVEELREAVILAGALQRRSERFGEAVAGAGASPIAPGARAEDLLSRRELQVLGMIAEGAPNSEIADRLVIAETTVQSHVQHILRKLGVRNRTEAATRYLRG